MPYTYTSLGCVLNIKRSLLLEEEEPIAVLLERASFNLLLYLRLAFIYS